MTAQQQQIKSFEVENMGRAWGQPALYPFQSHEEALDYMADHADGDVAVMFWFGDFIVDAVYFVNAGVLMGEMN